MDSRRSPDNGPNFTPDAIERQKQEYLRKGRAITQVAPGLMKDDVGGGRKHLDKVAERVFAARETSDAKPKKKAKQNWKEHVA
jgi:hypothetical protein